MKAVKQFDILIFHIFLKMGIFLFPGIISIDILPAMCYLFNIICLYLKLILN